MSRIGVVGCGYWGAKQIRVFSQMESAQLTTVCDLTPERVERIRCVHRGVKATLEYEDLLNGDVDAIVVATPVNTHFSLARQALLAGKHVLVEKPLTTSTETASELIQLAHERGLVLMTGHTYEYHPAIEFLREMLVSGELGDLYYVDSARLSLGMFQPDVDVLWDLAPHDISILLYLIGQEPLWVDARATAHVSPSRFEVSYLGLEFPSKVLAHVHVSWLDPCKVRRLTLVGSKRMVVFDDVSPAEQVRIYDKGVTVNLNGNGGPEVVYRHGDVRIPFIPQEEPLQREAADFLECIRFGRRPRSDGEEGLKVINILEAAHESLANSGTRMRVTPVKQDEPALTNHAETIASTVER